VKHTLDVEKAAAKCSYYIASLLMVTLLVFCVNVKKTQRSDSESLLNYAKRIQDELYTKNSSHSLLYDLGMTEYKLWTCDP
jgi:ABC-type spermidine/putrescine transport system permease subunit I